MRISKTIGVVVAAAVSIIAVAGSAAAQGYYYNGGSGYSDGSYYQPRHYRSYQRNTYAPAPQYYAPAPSYAPSYDNY